MVKYSSTQRCKLYPKFGVNFCKIELNLSYDFDNLAMAALVGPVFDWIASSLVDAFVKRAEEVYGA